MLHILLSILRIIGILLLVLLILLLVLTVSVLFVPYSYQIRIQKDETFHMKTDITWLFHMVHFTFLYDKKSSFQFLVFGIPLPCPKRRKTETRSHNDRREYSETTDSISAKDKSEDMNRNKKSNSDETFENSRQSEKNKDYTPRSFYAKLKKWKTILSSEDFKWIVHMAWSEAKILITHIKPKKIKGNILFGFDDPANTGELLGVIGTLFPILPEDLIIIPDFTQSIFKGWVDAKGRVFGFYILKEILKVLLDGKTIPVFKKYMHKEA